MNKNNTLFFNAFVLGNKKYSIKNLVMSTFFFFLYRFREAAMMWQKDTRKFPLPRKEWISFTNFHL
jgi:hypothetical protein